jgi:hypothetical protein
VSGHQDHLPPRKHLNKAVDPRNPKGKGQVDQKALEAAARGQGKGTKNDAKRAVKGDRN